jgi:hypothetical protein
LKNRLIGCHETASSRRGATSVTIQLAVTQHQGQIGSTQNSTAVFDMRPVSRSRLRRAHALRR